MAFQAYGYTKSRQHLASDVTFIELRAADGTTPVVYTGTGATSGRLAVGTAVKCPAPTQAGLDVTYTVTVLGSDFGALPVTIGGYGLYDAATGTNVYASNTTSSTATLNNAADSAIITITENTPA